MSRHAIAYFLQQSTKLALWIFEDAFDIGPENDSSVRFLTTLPPSPANGQIDSAALSESTNGINIVTRTISFPGGQLKSFGKPGQTKVDESSA
jgi:hypothetical protein